MQFLLFPMAAVSLANIPIALLCLLLIFLFEDFIAMMPDSSCVKFCPDAQLLCGVGFLLRLFDAGFFLRRDESCRHQLFPII